MYVRSHQNLFECQPRFHRREINDCTTSIDIHHLKPSKGVDCAYEVFSRRELSDHLATLPPFHIRVSGVFHRLDPLPRFAPSELDYAVARYFLVTPLIELDFTHRLLTPMIPTIFARSDLRYVTRLLLLVAFPQLPYALHPPTPAPLHPASHRAPNQSQRSHYRTRTLRWACGLDIRLHWARLTSNLLSNRRPLQ